ncbi:hypothetical protein [Nostoc sp. MG11]|uniref:hypothetical protein n=1 Tax=Nostoc sp. MG11 TaxID=2721166 RepID=UPI0018668722|nr:hypothetical protein [Nostoc sp. MG11]
MQYAKHRIQVDKDTGKYSQVLVEAKQLELDYRCLIDKLYLLKISDRKLQISLSKHLSI